MQANPDKALKQYRKVLVRQPRHFDALQGAAILYAQAGQFRDAEPLFARACEVQPGNAIAWFYHGLALHNLGRYDEALASYDRALSLKADFPEALSNRGNILTELQRYDEALASYDKALSFKPDYANVYTNRGSVLRYLQRYEEALASFDEALALNPGLAEAHNNRGMVLRDLHRHDEALAAFDKALSLKAGLSEAHNNRGMALRELQRLDEALASFDKALSLNANLAEAHNNRGMVLRDLQRHEEALASYDRALALKADYAEAHNHRGNVLRDLQRPEGALAAFDKALSLNAGSAEAHNNRGNALRDLRRYDESLASYDQALALKADYAEAHINRGNVLSDLQRYDAALAGYDRAIGLDRDSADAFYHKALALLALGRFEEGWRLHEWRWKTHQMKRELRCFGQPLWLGAESLSGRTILLHGEQGWGDIIQFVRYVPRVEALGATVVLEVPAPLVSLFRTLPGNARVVSKGSPLPAFDVHCPLMSLPLAFGTTLETIPASPAYLAADPAHSQRWAERLGQRDGLGVGLVWAGSPTMYADRRRSVPLSSFAVLADVPGVRFFSLQLGPASAQLADVRRAHWAGPEIADFTNDIHDWADTAAVVANLDLVIACDTGAAHLAAAMGKPTWILNRYDTCWRWLTGREDSPWYPSVRLFRQSQPGDWEPVLDRVKAELVQLAMDPQLGSDHNYF